MTNSERIYNTITEKRDIKFKDTPVISVNINYPAFEPSDITAAERNFVKKINRFYADSAKKYVTYLSGKFAKKAFSVCSANGAEKLSFTMNCTVSYADMGYISVFADISTFNGKTVTTYRFSQLWSKEKNAILPPGYVFNTGVKQKKYVKEILCEMASKNFKLRGFSYFDNYRSIINRKFDFSRFYIVPKGMAFYFDKGILTDVSNEVCVFVVPFEKIDGMIKIGFAL